VNNDEWAPFEALPKSLCECFCGGTWRSHARLVRDDDGMRIAVRVACPLCGSDRPRAVRSDPETFTIRG
jgi:hypothetical protein